MPFRTLNVPGGNVTVKEVLSALNSGGPKVAASGQNLEILHKGYEVFPLPRLDSVRGN
jgi:hypothetical protein